jgi:RNA polymerase sigma-70 factor (ECF subfamily)
MRRVESITVRAADWITPGRVPWGAMVYSRAWPLPGSRPTFATHRTTTLVTDAPSEILALRALDPEAVSAVHARYFVELYRYAAYRTGDPQLAEDLASEALIRLLEAVRLGKGPATSLRGWLMGTAAHLVNDHYRRAYGRPTEELTENLHSDGPDVSALAEQNERQADVRRAIRRLTPEQQHVLSLRFGSELSLEETAQLMERSVNAIKALQFRALAGLRRELGGRRS